MKQFDDMDTQVPIMPSELSDKDKEKALKYLMFLKEKRCGTVKGRGCADCCPQRIYTGKDEFSSKTVSIESVMITSIVDALQERDVVCVAVPGVFLQKEMVEVVYMVIRNKLVEALLAYRPEKYRKYVVYEKDVKVLYVKLKKALYGTLRASLFFWGNLTTALKSWGFALNPHNEYVANKYSMEVKPPSYTMWMI